jgi:hypothetical protein
MAVEVLAYTSGHTLVRPGTSLLSPCKYEHHVLEYERGGRWYVLHPDITPLHSTPLQCLPLNLQTLHLVSLSLISSIVCLFYSYIHSLALPINQLCFFSSHSRSSEDATTGTWLNHSSPFILRNLGSRDISTNPPHLQSRRTNIQTPKEMFSL